METLTAVLGPLNPYGVAALGAALLGYGLLSGLLLVRRHGAQFVRPYFMSAFGMAIVAFLVAAMERPVQTWWMLLLKLLVVLVTLGYGVALVRRAWTRTLANRPLGAYVVVGVVTTALPGVPGVIGTVLAREALIRAVSSSPPESIEVLLRTQSVQIWTPLLAAAFGGAFLAVSFLLLLVRKASGR